MLKILAMTKHAKVYLKHFDLVEDEIYFCEYSFIKYGAYIIANDVHHIIYKSQGGGNDIENIMALSRKVHDLAHQERVTKNELFDIHEQFMAETLIFNDYKLL